MAISVRNAFGFGLVQVVGDIRHGVVADRARDRREIVAELGVGLGRGTVGLACRFLACRFLAGRFCGGRFCGGRFRATRFRGRRFGACRLGSRRRGLLSLTGDARQHGWCRCRMADPWRQRRRLVHRGFLRLREQRVGRLRSRVFHLLLGNRGESDIGLVEVDRDLRGDDRRFVDHPRLGPLAEQVLHVVRERGVRRP